MCDELRGGKDVSWEELVDGIGKEREDSKEVLGEGKVGGGDGERVGDGLNEGLEKDKEF